MGNSSSSRKKQQRGTIYYQKQWVNEQQLQKIYVQSVYKTSPKILFGDNDIDKNRPCNQHRKYIGGLSKIMGPYDRSIGYGITTTFYRRNEVPSFDIFKNLMDEEFKPLQDHLINGNDVIILSPTPNDIKTNGKQKYFKNDKQVIHHNIGTGIARLDFKYIEYIQQKLDELVDFADNKQDCLYYKYKISSRDNKYDRKDNDIDIDEKESLLKDNDIDDIKTKNGRIYYQTGFYDKQQMENIDNKFHNDISKGPKMLFGDNYIDKYRDAKTKRKEFGGQSTELGKYDRSYGFGIPTTFKNAKSHKFIYNESNFKSLIDAEFNKLIQHISNGGDIIIPYPTKNDLVRGSHKYFQVIHHIRKQVIHHNIGTGTAALSCKYLLYIQCNIDKLKQIAKSYKFVDQKLYEKKEDLGDDDQVIMEAYLMKESLHFELLKKRFISLNNHYLYSYQTHEKIKITETILLKQFRSVQLSQNGQLGQFELVPYENNKKRVFVAESMNEAKAWVNACKQIINYDNHRIALKQLELERMKEEMEAIKADNKMKLDATTKQFEATTKEFERVKRIDMEYANKRLKHEKKRMEQKAIRKEKELKEEAMRKETELKEAATKRLKHEKKRMKEKAMRKERELKESATKQLEHEQKRMKEEAMRKETELKESAMRKEKKLRKSATKRLEHEQKRMKEEAMRKETELRQSFEMEKERMMESAKSDTERVKKEHRRKETKLLETQKILETITEEKEELLRNAEALNKKPKTLKEYEQGCPVMFEAARVLIKHWKIPSEFLDDEYDKCYCQQCHKERGEETIIHYAGEPAKKYGLPLGWTKFGINIDQGKFKMNKIWETWHVAFHGTQERTVPEIFKSGLHLLKPGDTTISGYTLPVRKGHILKIFGRTNEYTGQKEKFDPNQIFVSPSIKYAGNAIYAEPFEVFENKTKVKCAFQLKIRPKSYKIGQETIRATEKKETIDANFKNNELEWYTKENVGIEIYSLLIKIE